MARSHGSFWHKENRPLGGWFKRSLMEAWREKNALCQNLMIEETIRHQLEEDEAGEQRTMENFE